MKTFCKQCGSDKEIVTPGKYANVLECNHVLTSIPASDILKSNPQSNAVEAQNISESLNRIETLPKIDHNELIERATRGLIENYEDFFTTESVVIEDLIKEHGKDNALLIMTAIHAHMSKVLFTMNRFRNFYYATIEKMRKEVEDKAVKELIQNHDFHYTPTDKKPKKIYQKLSKSGTDVDAAKKAMAGLTDKDGKPLDVMKVMANLMWKKTPNDLVKDMEKDDYKAGLKKIADSIQSKDSEK